MYNAHSHIYAIVLAAGSSRRMGEAKLIKPWGSSTIIESVVRTVSAIGTTPIIVLGTYAVEIQDLFPRKGALLFAINEGAESSGMLVSVQTGLRKCPEDCLGVFIVLGDQPQVTGIVYQTLLNQILLSPETIIVPTFGGKRGHPWWLPNRFFDEVLEMDAALTLKDFQQTHPDAVTEVQVDEGTILRDIDTIEDYKREVNGE